MTIKALKSWIIQLPLILLIIAILAGCSDVIGPIQDFKNNKYPEIISFTSDPENATNLTPNDPVILTVTAMDPEGEPLRFAYDSEDGSFADQADTAYTSTVTFYSASYLTSSQSVKARVKVTDDKKFSVSQELTLGTTREGPTITSIGEIPVYVKSDSCAEYTFSANENGIYQVLVYDSTGATASYDSSQAAYFYGAGEHITVTIDGPSGSGGNAKLITPPDKVAVILRDSLLATAVSEFILNLDDDSPVSSVNPASGTSTFSAFPVTITAADAKSGVSCISYTINGADPDFSGSGTVVQGSTVVTTIGSSGIGTYTLKYRAMDNVGNIEEIKSATYTIQNETTPPGDVTLTVTQAGSGYIYVSWTEPLDIDYDHVLLSWSSSAGGSLVTLYKGTTSYIISATNNITYTITAVAVDTIGNQSAGTSIEIVPPSALMTVFFIPTAARLYELQQNTSYYGYYCIVTADIDLTAYSNWTPIGNYITPFAGRFEGNNHIITKLTINNSGSDYQGLFANVSGTIRNVTLTSIAVAGYSRVGGLTGHNTGSISGCSVSGNISGGASYTGGLVGYCNSGSITNCSSSVNVTGSGYTGGLAGYCNGSTVTNCSVSGTITGTALYTGGLIGSNSGGSITNCSSTVTIQGTATVGGLLGANTGSVSECHASGISINGTYNVGGLIGFNTGSVAGTSSNYTYAQFATLTGTYYIGGLIGQNSGPVTYCMADVDVISTDIGTTGCIGGLIGYNAATIQYCNAYGPVSGTYYTGGLIGENNSASVSYCSATGSVSGTHDYTGGLIGDNSGNITSCSAAGETRNNESSYAGGLIAYNKGNVTGCYATGAVFGRNLGTGGLIGYNTGGYITYCHYTVSAYSDTVSGYNLGVRGVNDATGGFVGENVSGGIIEYCYVTLDGSLAENIYIGAFQNSGGFVGYNDSTIRYCYTTVPVIGWTSENFGGFAGSNAGTITNCYARGTVMELAGSPGQYFGGFAGYNTGTIGYCYETGAVSGTSDAYGLVGFDYNGGNTIQYSYYNNANASNGIGNGLTLTAMQNLNNFTGFNVSIWTRGSLNNGYPYLQAIPPAN